LRDMKPFWFVKNCFLATSLVTVAVMIPLNSIIIVHPYEPVCVSCLVTVYGSLIVFTTFGLFLLQCSGGWWYNATLKSLTVVALIALLARIPWFHAFAQPRFVSFLITLASALLKDSPTVSVDPLSIRMSS